MAEKKKAALSYGADLGLIQGERAVAESLSKTGAGAKAFGEAFTKVLKSAMDQKKKRDKGINDHIDDMGGVTNTPLLEIGDNKLVVTNFVRNQRDKAKKFAERLHKDRNDREAKDGLAAIKQSFINLNAQIKSFTEEKTEYLDAGPEMLGDPRVYDADKYFDFAYTNKGVFSITDDGNIEHTVNGKPHLYKNKTQKWNNKNVITLQEVVNDYTTVETNALAGNDDFNRAGVKRKYKNHFLYADGVGVDGSKQFASQDFLEDDEYMLDDGSVAGKMSFADMWVQGRLADKFYDEKEVIGKIEGYEEGSNAWMFDDDNADLLAELQADYIADVMEDGHNRAFAKYKPEVGQKKGPEYTQKYYTDRQISVDKANEIIDVFNANLDEDIPWRDIRGIEIQKGYKIKRTDAEGLTDVNGGHYSLFTVKDNGDLVYEDWTVDAKDKTDIIGLLHVAAGVHKKDRSIKEYLTESDLGR